METVIKEEIIDYALAALKQKYPECNITRDEVYDDVMCAPTTDKLHLKVNDSTLSESKSNTRKQERDPVNGCQRTIHSHKNGDYTCGKKRYTSAGQEALYCTECINKPTFPKTVQNQLFALGVDIVTATAGKRDCYGNLSKGGYTYPQYQQYQQYPQYLHQQHQQTQHTPEQQYQQQPARVKTVTLDPACMQA